MTFEVLIHLLYYIEAKRVCKSTVFSILHFWVLHLVCHRTVRCCKRTKDFNGQTLQTPTVGSRGKHQTMNSVMSGAPPDYPVCPSTAPARIVVGAINTPNHHHSSHPSFRPSHSILEQRHTLQDTIKGSNPLQVPKSTQVLSDLREGNLCFFCWSCCLDCFLLLIIILLSAL
jgi:hypothetical protein